MWILMQDEYGDTIPDNNVGTRNVELSRRIDRKSGLLRSSFPIPSMGVPGSEKSKSIARKE